VAPFEVVVVDEVLNETGAETLVLPIERIPPVKAALRKA
jgi:hypothetical protein